MKRFGLIGYPLTHSFSKKYFTEKFEREKLSDYAYGLFPLSSIVELPALIENNPDLAGLNVTIPYKQEVLKYIDVSKLPEGVQACNCIRITDGTLTGYNTDVIGFEKTFVGPLQSVHEKALVLGNGGATEAVCYVLRKLNIPYHIVSRQLHKGSTLTYDELDKDLLRAHKIIINTTPVGTYPDVDHCPNIPYEYIGPDHYLFDLIYNPAKTLFLQKGEARGAVIKNGYDMLVVQAEESWKIWT